MSQATHGVVVSRAGWPLSGTVMAGNAMGGEPGFEREGCRLASVVQWAGTVPGGCPTALGSLLGLALCRAAWGLVAAVSF